MSKTHSCCCFCCVMMPAMKSSPPDILIRDAFEHDAELIAQFNDAMALETEGRSLDTPTVCAGVEAVFAQPNLARFFIAEIDGRNIGQAMITYEWSDWRNGVFWWLQSVYVHPKYRRRGVFSALFDHIQALARRTEGVVGLRLYVEDHNGKAMSTYAKLGFKPSGHAVQEIDWSGLPAVSAP